MAMSSTTDGEKPSAASWIADHISSQVGRTFIVTGANSGLGLETVRALGALGGNVIMTARDRNKGEQALEELLGAQPDAKIELRLLDLADLDSVVQFAGGLGGFDVLINNAGVMMPPHGRTRQGYELQFGVNHLGHFALTTALLDRLAASAPARVVTVSSDAHYQATGIDYDAVRRRTAHLAAMPEYAVSKLANVLFSQELARRAADRGITTYALHPGVVASDIWRRVPWPVRPIITRNMLTTEQGAATTLYCATSPDVAQATGRFYIHCREAEPSRVATPELAQDLWEHSEAWTG